MLKVTKTVCALKILLVENDPSDTRSISELLKDDDSGAIELCVAQTLSECMQIIVENPPEAVLLDLALTDSSGLESVRKIRGLAPQIPIVVLTGLDDQEFGLMAVKAGAQDSINKSYVRGSSLVLTLRHSIERQRLANEREQQTKSYRTSHANLLAVIEASGDAILVCKPEGQILFVNRTAEELFGGSDRPLTGTKFGFPLTNTENAEIRIPGNDDRPATNEMRIVEIAWQGEPALMVTLHDTTKRREAEEETFATNRALRASEERFRAFMQASPESLFLQDRDGRYLAVNPAFEKRYGLLARDVIGRQSNEILPVDRAQVVDSQDEQVLSREEAATFETDFVDPQGRRFIEKTVKFPIRDVDGTVMGMGSIATEITSLKLAHKALERSNRALRALSACNDALIHAESEELLLSEVCRLIVELGSYPFAAVGFKEGEGANWALRTVTHFGTTEAPDPSKWLANAGKDVHKCPMCRAARTGRPVIVQNGFTGRECSPCREFAKSNELPSALFLPLNSGEGVFGAVAIFSGASDSFDTEEVRLLKELIDDLAFGIQTLRADERRRNAEASMRNLQLAVEQSPNIVMITDPNGTIEYVNPKFFEITGYTSEAAIGENPRLLKSGKTTPEEYKDLWETITAGHEWRGTVHNKRKDGSVYFGETAISPVRDDRGSITHFICIQEDITEKIEGDIRLRQAEKMESLGSLASGIAHDFNNMLLPILSLSAMTMREMPEGSRQRERLRNVVEAAGRAQELVRQVLAFSRRGETTKSTSDLVSVIREAIALLRATLPSTIELRTHLESSVGTAFFDPAQVQTMILNLASNAADAMAGKPGRIDISLRRSEVATSPVHGNDNIVLEPGSYAKLTVKDDGPSIPEAILPRIFEPFFTTKGAGEGTGLGLAMVHGIVKDHSGSISAENAIGGGATFTIHLPLETETKAT